MSSPLGTPVIRRRTRSAALRGADQSRPPLQSMPTSAYITAPCSICAPRGLPPFLAPDFLFLISPRVADRRASGGSSITWASPSLPVSHRGGPSHPPLPMSWHCSTPTTESAPSVCWDCSASYPLNPTCNRNASVANIGWANLFPSMWLAIAGYRAFGSPFRIQCTEH